jgi:hypothetical protein
MKKKAVLLGIILAILSVWAVGCYTVLTHPRVQGEEGYVVEHTGSYYRENCTNCHGDYHNYPYGFYYGYYPDYYWNQPRWGRYYAYPWWWDRYWWDDDYDYYDSYESDPLSSEKADRRRGMVPPYVSPTGTVNTPFILPGSTGDQQTGQTTQPDKQKATKIDNQDKDKDQKKEDKAERRRR